MIQNAWQVALAGAPTVLDWAPSGPDSDDEDELDDESMQRLCMQHDWFVARAAAAWRESPAPISLPAAKRAERRLALACIRSATPCAKSSSLRVAAAALQVLRRSLVVLRGSPVVLLPQLAQSWPLIASAAQRSAHVELRIHALSCLADGLCNEAAGGDFLHSRAREELWPLLVGAVVEGASRLAAPEHQAVGPQTISGVFRTTAESLTQSLTRSKTDGTALSIEQLRSHVRSSGYPGWLRMCLEAALCIAALCRPTYRHGDRGYAGDDADALEQDGIDADGNDRPTAIMPVAAAMQRRQKEAAADAAAAASGSSTPSGHGAGRFMHVWTIGPGAKPRDVPTATGMRFGLAPLQNARHVAEPDR